MDRADILAKISTVMEDIFDEEGLVASEEMIADDVEEWDSTNHVRLMVALEEKFGIRFESDEITAPDTVGELVTLVAGKLNA